VVTYEVTASVAPALAADYERYMRGRHIPDLLATGAFIAASFGRSADGRYRVRYEAPDAAALDAYLADHAPRLRADLASHFPDGVALEREVWAVVEAWGPGRR
jgi:hypothetical protein